MRVFVTGGTGLVGRHVISQLLARGDSVVGLARSEGAADALRAAGAEVLRGDLADAGALRRGVESADATVHAAAIVLGRSADWTAFRDANVTPTATIAGAAGRAGRRLIHVSSVAVYGRRTTYAGGPGSVRESFGLERPLFAGDHYARSKREAEQAVWAAADAGGLSAVALRPCVIYGEGDRNFANRVARALRFGVAPLIGRGDNVLSVVYAGNVAAAVLAALDRPHVTGAFNVANDGALTQRGFLEHFARGMACRVRFVAVPSGLARSSSAATDTLVRLLRPRSPMTLMKTAVQFLGGENPYVSDKARAELGWTPALEPAVAVERTAAWFASGR